eukprot:NODE_1157_length_1981_cov_0.648778.p2 type:complete len:127 gc:universal NODE_1157_length_1981_cov_0.648778:833-1213(+)
MREGAMRTANDCLGILEGDFQFHTHIDSVKIASEYILECIQKRNDVLALMKGKIRVDVCIFGSIKGFREIGDKVFFYFICIHELGVQNHRLNGSGHFGCAIRRGLGIVAIRVWLFQPGEDGGFNRE